MYVRSRNHSYFNYLVLVALGLSGAAALTYEIVSSKFFSYFMGSSTYSVSTMLSAFLFGIALGSFAMSRVIGRIGNKRLMFVILQFCVGVYALLFLAKLDWFPHLLLFFYRFSGSSLFLLTISKFLAGIVYLLLPTMLLGASFPLAGSLLIRNVKRVGIDLGTLYSLDTFGAILGAGIAGFVLLPVLGLKLTVLMGALLNFGSGFLILEKNVKNTAIFLTGCFMALIPFFLIQMDTSREIPLFDLQKSHDSIFGETPCEKKTVFQKNTPYGVVSVLRWCDEDGNTRFNLAIDKRVQCYTGAVSEKVISHLVLANFERPVDVLNLGLGCGFTLAAILEHDNVRKADVVEINPTVAEVAEKFFSADTGYVLKDPRTSVILDDAAHFLLSSNKRYDAIVVDVEEPGIPHSSPLYTVEYFQVMAHTLSDDGVFGLWAVFNDYDYMKNLYYSLKEVFPYVYVTLEYERVPLFIASKKRLDLPQLKENMNYPHMERFSDFDRELIRKFDNDVNYTLNTLDNPILEYFGVEEMKDWGELKAE